MKLKRGITVTMMVITVIILLILASTITISVYSGINYSKLSSWKSEIVNIQNVVKEKLNESSIIDEYILGSISVSKDSIPNVEFTNQFSGETVDSDNNVILYALDLGKLGITDTMYGNYTTSTDVYAISKETNKVYYVQGLELGNDTYYTITSDDLENLENTENVLSSVVFVPNTIGYTNKPIKVTVKLPNTSLNPSIGTNNSEIIVGSLVNDGDMQVVEVNTNEIPGNYIITVSYNDGAKVVTTNYEVNGYDSTTPVINEITSSNYIYKQTAENELKYLTNITASDDNSGVKYLKYIEGNATEDMISVSGKVIKDGTINLNKDVNVYTIYAEDNAGNYALKYIDITTFAAATIATEQ